MTHAGGGSEQFNDEDRVYPARASAKSWMRCSRIRISRCGAARANRHCRTRSDIRSVFGGLLCAARTPRFERASERTLDSGADLRWGPDRKGFTRLLHPNGVCLVGRWQITEDTPYSGYFARGRDGARRRPLLERRREATRRGRIRSLALVGKLFPTTDPDHPTPLRTANFITQEDIGGARSDSINDAELRNAPDVTVFRRGPAGTMLIKVAAVFRRVDRQPTIRQLYPIAELGKPAGEPTRAPAFMRLLVAPGQPVIPGDDLDVRDEVMAHIFDRGDPAPKRTLTFTIEVTDDGTTSDRRSACAARSGTGGGLARSCSTTPSCRIAYI